MSGIINALFGHNKDKDDKKHHEKSETSTASSTTATGVGKVSSRFEYFREIFVIRLVSTKLMTVSDRASNILQIRSPSKTFYHEKNPKNFKKLVF